MFRVENFIIDRILRMYLLEEANGDLLAYSEETQDATIDFGAETVDVTNAQGSVVKRFFRNKTASLTTTQSYFNVGLAALEMGGDRQYATTTASFKMPASVYVKSGETAVLDGIVDGTEKVYGLDKGGNTSAEAYAKDTTASTNKYSLTSEGLFTPPTNTEETGYFVYYQKTVNKNGVKIVNAADKFPRNVYIVIVALGYDLCDANNNDPRLLVIEGDSFQISPENSLQLSGGDTQTMDFSGEFLASVCGDDKGLLTIYVVDEDDNYEPASTDTPPTIDPLTATFTQGTALEIPVSLGTGSLAATGLTVTVSDTEAGTYAADSDVTYADGKITIAAGAWSTASADDHKYVKAVFNDTAATEKIVNVTVATA